MALYKIIVNDLKNNKVIGKYQQRSSNIVLFFFQIKKYIQLNGNYDKQYFFWSVAGVSCVWNHR